LTGQPAAILSMPSFFKRLSHVQNPFEIARSVNPRLQLAEEKFAKGSLTGSPNFFKSPGTSAVREAGCERAAGIVTQVF